MESPLVVQELPTAFPEGWLPLCRDTALSTVRLTNSFSASLVPSGSGVHQRERRLPELPLGAGSIGPGGGVRGSLLGLTAVGAEHHGGAGLSRVQAECIKIQVVRQVQRACGGGSRKLCTSLHGRGLRPEPCAAQPEVWAGLDLYCDGSVVPSTRWTLSHGMDAAVAAAIRTHVRWFACDDTLRIMLKPCKVH